MRRDSWRYKPDCVVVGCLAFVFFFFLQAEDGIRDATVTGVQTCALPVPENLARRAADIKGSAYFLDASGAGICRVPVNAWLAGAQRPPHDFAVVVLVEHPRQPEADNLAHNWVRSARAATMDMRAAEIACCLAEYVRRLGFGARAHIAGDRLVDVERLAVLAGLAARPGGGTAHHPLPDNRSRF